MDDALEKPNFDNLKRPDGLDDNGAHSEDEEEGVPDWTRFATSAGKPYIPRRGEKEHEPAGGVSADGSGLQQHKLERARAAMYGAIDVDRVVSSKNISHALWLPQQSRARLFRARGNFMNTMGYSVSVESRHEEVRSSGEVKKAEKAVDLLPEEALYLVERGSLLCWSQLDMTGDDPSGTPLSVQQSHAEMIGRDGLSIEKFQVYAYFKRLGYTVVRAPVSGHDSGLKTLTSCSPTLLDTLRTLWREMFSALHSLITVGRRRDWWSPIGFGAIHPFTSQSVVFSALRFLQVGGGKCQSQEHSSITGQSPYRIFYHVYKPPTPYRKSAPPPADFHIVIVNARETPIPTLPEFCELFDNLPDIFPAKPREGAISACLSSSKPASEVINKHPNGLRVMQRTLLQNIFSSIRGFLRGTTKGRNVTSRRPNPFQALKMGNKMVVVAAVDNGVISFYRFGEGVFQEWPMQ